MADQPMPRDDSIDEQLMMVLSDVIRRRAAGEDFSDDAIISEHPQLMPELGEQLLALQAVEAAERRVDARPPSTAGEHASGYLVEHPLAGDRFKALTGYTLLAEIHRGVQAVVYKAVEPETGRLVAIKVIHNGWFARCQDRLRFEDEVRILNRLRHPNIVAIHKTGCVDDMSYFVMDLIDGPSLSDYMSLRPRPVRETVLLFMKICEAITAAHQNGVIHRDLKPENIRVDNSAEPHVLDFGLAKYVQDHREKDPISRWLTAPWEFVGTLPWASPEQVVSSADADTRSDVYALGLILYHMLTSQFPYFVNGDLRTTCNNIVEAEPRKPRTYRREIGDELETIILKCLSKDADRRYQHAGDLVQDLRRHVEGKAIEAKHDSAWYVLRRHARRHRAIVMFATGALVVVVFLLALTLAKLLESRELARQRDRAMDAEAQARAAHGLVERQAEELRTQDYVNHIGLAQQAWHDNAVGRMRHLLSACSPELRGWEWRYLQHIADGSSVTFQRDSQPVNSVAFPPGGATIAAGSRGGGLALWDVRTGQALLDIGDDTSDVSAVAFGPDGSWFVVASSERDLRVWDTKTAQLLHTLQGHASPVLSVACGGNGTEIVSGGADHTVILWDARTGVVRSVLRGHDDAVTAVALDSRHSRIASGSDDRTVRVWDSTNAGGPRVLGRHSDCVGCIAFSPDGTRVASGGRDRAVRMWDIGTGKETVTFRGHEDWITGVVFSRTGEWLASCSRDGTVRVWDASSGAGIATLRGHEGPVLSIASSPLEDALVTGCEDGAIKRWDYLATGDAIVLTGHQRSVLACSFSADGRWLVSGDRNSLIKLWDVQTAREVCSLRGHGAGVVSVAVSPDGREMVSGGGDGAIVLWMLRTGERLKVLGRHDGAVVSLSFNPDGSCIASAGTDRTIRLWNTRTGDAEILVRDNTGGVNAVAWSPDGEAVVSGNADGTLRTWNVITRRMTGTLTGHHDQVRCVGWSHDGTRIVSGSSDGTVATWDASTGNRLRTFDGHLGSVRSVAFTPDETRVISGGDDRTVRLWICETGHAVLTLPGHTDEVTSVAVDPSGTRIVSASRDGTLRLWECSAESAAVRQQRSLNATARSHVDALFEQLVFADAVRTQLTEDLTLSRVLRAAALELVACRGDDPVRLNNLAWEIARSPLRDAGEYRESVRMAQAAQRLVPDNEAYLNTLGVALYRAGAFASALEALRDSDTLAVAANREVTHRLNLAFMALSLEALGQGQEASAVLERLQALMEVPPYASDNQLLPFVQEAEAVILDYHHRAP